MIRKTAYEMFDDVIEAASTELVESVEEDLDINHKHDEIGGRTVVTNADRRIDAKAKPIVDEYGIPFVSEEGEHDIEIVKTGNYAILDSVDGTLALIEHVKKGSPQNPAIDPTLGERYDYSLLIGIVEDGRPRFGCCYNYVTGEKIYLDSEGDVRRTGPSRKEFEARLARYVDSRSNDPINQRIAKDPAVSTYYLGSLGIASIYAQLYKHEAAVISHFPQENGLWDILPGCVLSEADKSNGTRFYDGHGNEISYTDYILIPKGVVMIRGDKFNWVIDELRKTQE